MSGAMDSMKQYIETVVAVNLMKSLVADNKTDDAVEKTNDFIVKTFPDNPQAVRRALAALVLDYVGVLMKDDPSGLQAAKQTAGV